MLLLLPREINDLIRSYLTSSSIPQIYYREKSYFPKNTRTPHTLFPFLHYKEPTIVSIQQYKGTRAGISKWKEETIHPCTFNSELHVPVNDGDGRHILYVNADTYTIFYLLDYLYKDGFLFFDGMCSNKQYCYAALLSSSRDAHHFYFINLLGDRNEDGILQSKNIWTLPESENKALTLMLHADVPKAVYVTKTDNYTYCGWEIRKNHFFHSATLNEQNLQEQKYPLDIPLSKIIPLNTKDLYLALTPTGRLVTIDLSDKSNVQYWLQKQYSFFIDIAIDMKRGYNRIALLNEAGELFVCDLLYTHKFILFKTAQVDHPEKTYRLFYENAHIYVLYNYTEELTTERIDTDNRQINISREKLLIYPDRFDELCLKKYIK